MPTVLLQTYDYERKVTSAVRVTVLYQNQSLIVHRKLIGTPGTGLWFEKTVTVTHLPSSLRVTSFETVEAAKAFVDRVASHHIWSKVLPGASQEDVTRNNQALVQSGAGRLIREMASFYQSQEAAQIKALRFETFNIQS